MPQTRDRQHKILQMADLIRRHIEVSDAKRPKDENASRTSFFWLTR